MPSRPRGRALTVQAMESETTGFEDIMARFNLQSSSEGNFTKTDSHQTTVGSFSLKADWGPNTDRPKDVRGKISCYTGEKVEGFMYFDVFVLASTATFAMMPKSSDIDGSKLCAEVGYVKSQSNKRGVGAACIYMLALVAERLNAPYMMVSSSIVDSFYVKMGFKNVSKLCDDMFGLTATVKSQTQSHLK